jgi:hypothetical protein
MVGAAVGVAAGAAVANAASANAYAAAVNSGYIMGDLYPTLPLSCSYTPIGGRSYYGCGNGLWFAPSYGANGMFYRVIPAP